MGSRTVDEVIHLESNQGTVCSNDGHYFPELEWIYGVQFLCASEIYPGPCQY